MNKITTIHSSGSAEPLENAAVLQNSDRGSIRAAAVQARVAQREWVGLGPSGRGAALGRIAFGLRREERRLVDLVVEEVGKPIKEAKGEIARGISIMEYSAQQVFDPDGDTYPSDDGGLLYAKRYPRGIAGLITPWNFPIAIPLWKAGPALASGNAVMLKPSSEATRCAALLEEIISAEVPEGLFTVHCGGAAVAKEVVESSDVVSFTGSSFVGRQVVTQAADRGIPVQAEMGGLNPAIVLADADLERTVSDLAYAAMGFAGQKCTATRRIICVGGVEADLVPLLIEKCLAMPVGDPSDPSVSIGPVINDLAAENIRRVVNDAIQAGAEVLYLGQGYAEGGRLLGPALLSKVPRGTELEVDETFGPVVQIESVATIGEAIDRANSSKYGLTGAVYGQTAGECLQVADALEVGMAKINAPTSGVTHYAPFGGSRESSYGPREQGKAARELYTSLRTVTFNSYS